MNNFPQKLKTLILVLFTLSLQYAQAQFPEGFEGATFPPAGWASFIGTNGLGTSQDWRITIGDANTGTQSAFVRYEDVIGGLAEDWLVTPQFTPTAVLDGLSIFHRQQYENNEYGTTYTIRVSTTSQTNHADFTIIETMTESDFSGSFTEKIIDLSAYNSQPIYVAFVMVQDDGDGWFIDDVSQVGSQPNPCLDFAAGPYTNFFYADACALGSCNTAVPGFEVYGNEAYMLTGLIGGTEYTFEFCTGYDSNDWPATIAIGEYDPITEMAVPGSSIATIDGCSLTFTPAADGDYIAVISETGVCGGAEIPTDNGTPTFQCTTLPCTSICGSSFTDAGGTLFGYSEGENKTYLLCPDNPSCERIRLVFNSFELEAETSCGFDAMNIFNGNSTAPADLVGTYCGTNSPGTIQSFAADGCLTVVFTSDISGSFAGWDANVNCVVLCPPICGMSQTDTSCGLDNGLLTVSPINAYEPITYNWSNGATTAAISNLAAGTYTVTVTADNGTFECSATVAGSSAVTGSVNSETICLGSSTTLTATVSGGNSPYNYQWTDGQVGATITVSPAATTQYGVIITDANDCEDILVGVVSVINLTCTTSSTDETCVGDDGTATVTTAGGTAPFNYIWIDGQTTQTAANLAAGSYEVSVVDANGCFVECVATVEEDCPIPDNCLAPNLTIDGSEPHISTLTIASGGSITDLDVTLDIDHTWVGDLIVTLEHADTGTSLTLIDQPGVPASGFGCGEDNIDCTLDDESNNGPVENACSTTDPAIGGNFLPEEMLSAFDGIDAAGDWILTITDQFSGGDNGVLNGWCLNITTGTASDPCIDGYAGANALTTARSTSFDYETDQTIESNQTLSGNILIDYDGKLGVDLLPGFDCQLGVELDVFVNDGCDNGSVGNQ